MYNRHDFCRKMPLSDGKLPVQIAFSPVFLCIIQSIFDLGIAVQLTETAMLNGPDCRRAAA